jgi:hypothetical protein
MAETSVSSIAERAMQTEAAAPIELPAVVHLGGTFDRLDGRENFIPRTRSTSVSGYDLCDVTLYGGLMILLRRGELIRETRYMISDGEWRDLGGAPPAATVATRGDTRVVIGCNRNFNNYYHWLAQAAPAIDHALRQPSDLPLSLALPAGCGRLQADTIRLLGFEATPVLQLEPYVGYALPFARYSEFLCGGTAFEVSRAAQTTYARLAQAVRDVPTGHDCLYVARIGEANRPMVNEAALIALMVERGVSVVRGAELTLGQQINLFRNARMVIGAHGAGLANIAFCRPGTVVYELVQESYPNACFNVLAQAGGLAYWSDAFPAAERTGPPPASVHGVAWQVDVDLVADRITEMGGPRRAAPPTINFRPPVYTPAAPAPAATTGAQLRVGVGVVTFNRVETLLRTLDRIGEHTGRDCELIVADDGSGDGTAARLRERRTPFVSGRNMGVAWNKNRALFHLAIVRACDVVILLEDDTSPSERDWQERWVEGALRWGHVNIAGEWFRSSFAGGAGTPENPILSEDVSAQCSAYTREALTYGGFMDPRFRGYGFEHVEHSWRLARHGFGGRLERSGEHSTPEFKLISGGLHIEHGASTGSAEQVDRNRDLCHRIMWEDHFRAPWTDEAEMSQFRAELAAAEFTPAQSGRP